MSAGEIKPVPTTADERYQVVESVLCPACRKPNPVAVYQNEHHYDGYLPDLAAPQICPECLPEYPPSLLKALMDPFEYALKLRSGEIYFFISARVNGRFVTLELDDDPRAPFEETGIARPVLEFPRGVDVRLSDFVWCADSPSGSCAPGRKE
jgi:hypothetical protein